MSHDTLFNQITDELESGGITGWCELAKAHDLAATVIASRPKVVVELGVWGGRSLLPMALACEHVRNGAVIAIDPWQAIESIAGYDKPNADWWGKQDHEAVYQGFLGHVKRLGLSDRIDVRRCTSDDAEIIEWIDLLHIDGQHSEQAVKDVIKFASHVPVGGTVCMDDLTWTVDGIAHVQTAVMALMALGFTELFRTNTDKGSWGFFRRIQFWSTYKASKFLTKKA